MSKFWNSLEDVSSAVNWTQLALILFGGITLSLTYVQYKLSTRKDFLSGSSQKQKEEILNKRVLQASNDATTSMIELEKAKKALIVTQEELAEATEHANAHLHDYLKSKEKLRKVDERSHKIITLQLRVDAFSSVPSDPQRKKATNIALNLITYLVKNPDKSEQSLLIFRGGTIEDIPISSVEIRRTAVLDIEDPLKVSGLDISALDGFQRIETNMFQGKGWGFGQISHLRWTLLVNGAAFPLTADAPPPQLPDIAQYGRIFIPISEDHSTISQLYEQLVK